MSLPIQLPTQLVIRPIKEIVSEFNSIVNKLILRMEKLSRSETELANIDRLKKRISLLKSMSTETVLIDNAGSYLLKYSDKILDPVAGPKFFLEADARSEAAANEIEVTSEHEYMFDLIDSIRKYYTAMKPAEKTDCFNQVKLLHDDYLEYAIALS